MHAHELLPFDSVRADASTPTGSASETIGPDFPPADLRAPSRQDVEGMMMRWMHPLVIDDAVRACATCGVYRDWIVGTEQMAAPPLGDEQWSQLLTYSVGPQRSVVQQTAIRIANVLVIVSGPPGLVDAHLAQAVDKVQRTR
ncbi:hypothetical protein [Streptomyces sp. NPDC058249]|uniref:hypothetical protein n=1 Tax=Streptomyces sp. NPDC058249 TaxID=3346403 RepID=UPI0036E3D796